MATKSSATPIAIGASLLGEGDSVQLSVELTNRSSETISVAALLPYLTLELLDAKKQYRRGAIAEGTPPVLTGKKDYRELRPGAACALSFSVTRTGTDERDGSGSYAIGPLRFTGIPAKTKLRATYKAEQLMPNMPRSGFFRGPASGEAELMLPE